jgi:2-keto-4-pentenoate hydratase/2-oxohepta-3-ene-1,7-dioic acid hydratase in catechol pathway
MAAWCAIRTFPKHAQEMSGETPPEPVFFLKPDAAIVGGNNPISEINCMGGQIHHEVEMVIQLDKNQKPHAIAIGLDLTLRDIQAELKESGLPWARAKSFSNSAVIGNWLELGDKLSLLEIGFDEYVAELHISLSLDGKQVQSANISEMSYSPSQQLKKLVQWAPMCTNDTLFTGTPSGVGPLSKGQKVVAMLKHSNGELLSIIDAVCI